MSQAEIAIRASRLSKVYRIGVREKTPDSLAGAVFDFVRSPIANFRKYRSLYRFDDLTEKAPAAGGVPKDVIWALRDVSFEIGHGEVVGIIGRNGAGKSTLLKLLTRITPPTRGRAEIRGRVSSLLEVGTGFHQELTGRENIYLNGTILGMTKREVVKKFDEIVDFSGVEAFLDTPVKRYSSGMAVRLAFAVAAHLEPEILIIDEVLAVGDAAFQKKCIGKMQDVGKQGRTILFVSHNMPAVRMLCSRAILIKDGGLLMDGTPHEIVSAYLTTDAGTPAARDWPDAESAPGGPAARLRGIRMVSADGGAGSSFDVRETIGIQMRYEVMTGGHVLMPHYYVYNDEGVLLFGTLDQDPVWRGQPREQGTYVSTAWIPGNFLSTGMIYVSCALLSRSTDTSQFYERHVIGFNVTDNMGEGTARGDWAGWLGGVVRPLLSWETQCVSPPDQPRLAKGK